MQCKQTPERPGCKCQDQQLTLGLPVLVQIGVFSGNMAPLLSSCQQYSSVALQVIPQLQGDATEQTPPDLPSYLFKERIVYLVS